MTAKIIDTHVHIWDLPKADYAWLRDDTSILNRTYTIEELEPERRKLASPQAYWCRQPEILKIQIGCCKRPLLQNG